MRARVSLPSALFNASRPDEAVAAWMEYVAAARSDEERACGESGVGEVDRRCEHVGQRQSAESLVQCDPAVDVFRGPVRGTTRGDVLVPVFSP